MFSRTRFFSVFVFTAILLLSACGKFIEDTKTAPTATIETRFVISVGGRSVEMQIAALPPELQKGLMFRKTMGADEGMLFVFTAPQPQGFWMRNTTLPLDIGYFDAAGELKEIYPMYPLDEKTVNARSRSIQFCLEMNQGWYARSGLKPGAKLDLKAVAEALRARGLKPEAAGLR